MKRAVYINCDGLAPDWINAQHTPTLARLVFEGRSASSHRAIMPSVTRVSAASVATGCYPQRHGLHGNRMALVHEGRLTVHDVAPHSFVRTLRETTGHALNVPTLAQRLRHSGGFAAYSNVSAGAAAFLDPDLHGIVRHREFGHATGNDAAPLAVSHDMSGDEMMTRQFIDDVLGSDTAACVLWLANPDLILHGAPLGSPEHFDALARSDACVAQVEEAIENRRRAGEDILLIVGSDHGQECVGSGADIHAWAESSGFGDALRQGKIAFATQGTAVLVYALEHSGPLLDALQTAPWAGEVATGQGLTRLHAHHGGALVGAVNMVRREGLNTYGVPGQRVAAFEGPAFNGIGFGQHGGWGQDEARPFLTMQHASLAQGRIDAPTCLVDIAPTILNFLGEPTEGMDGRSLLSA